MKTKLDVHKRIYTYKETHKDTTLESCLLQVEHHIPTAVLLSQRKHITAV